MKCALALCVILFAIGVMTNPFGKEEKADAEQTRSERERLRNQPDNYGGFKRGDAEIKEDKRELSSPINVDYKRADVEDKRELSSPINVDYKRADVEYKRAVLGQVMTYECDPLVNLWDGMIIYYAFCAPGIETPVVKAALETLKETFDGVFTFQDVTQSDFSCNAQANHYIAFKNDEPGCWSYIGKTGGDNQKLNLQTGSCESEGVVVHELLHAIGLYHTQQRSDAPDSITVHPENIKDGKAGNFELKNSICTNCKYQTCSIMHYRKGAFSRGQPTISAKNPAEEPKMGEQKQIHAGDICAVYSLYHEKTSQSSQESCNDPNCQFGTGWEPYNFKCCKCLKGYLSGNQCENFEERDEPKRLQRKYQLFNSPGKDQVTVESKKINGKYPLDFLETDFIFTEDNCKIEMTVVTFDIESDVDCYWDQTYLWYGTSVHDCPSTYCGSMGLGKKFTSDSNFVMIRLVSDDMYVFSGYTLDFKLVDCQPTAG